MSRPDRSKVLMQSAFLWAQRSTCSRLHVGCVIEREGRILVQGYNGAPAGLKHCNHDCTCPAQVETVMGKPEDREVFDYITHTPSCNLIQPCTRAVHAEQNAIAHAARLGVGLEGSWIWVTNQPCLSCAQSIINAGIVRVLYAEPYRLVDGVKLLEEAKVQVTGLSDPYWAEFRSMIG